MAVPAISADDKVASIAGNALILAAASPTMPEVVNEANEVARLERLPVVSIPVQDDTLASAITTIATACGMNFIAPPTDEFPERVTLTTKINPWRLLHRLGERYRFTMAFHDGIWEFNREAAGALVAKVYFLKHTNLDIYKTSQNAFSTIGSISNTTSGGSSATDGGMVFSAQTQKIIDDIRDLIGLTAARLAESPQAPDGEQKRSIEGKAGEAAPENRSGSKVIYIPDENALYVACTHAQHELVEGYIRVIDQPQRQIHIEARFFETSWDPKTVLGISPANFQPTISLSSLHGEFDPSRFSTHSEKATLSMDAVSLQINALQTDSKSRLVQNPSVVTVNNREVYFSVGDEEPFVSSNNIYPGVPNGGFGATTASISIRRIGTSVNVVPTIFNGENGSKRRIRLVVRIEVGALKEFRQINNVSVPVVSSQKYEYTTFVEDNQALAFGGLAGIGESDGVKKVPLAGDVPVVGYLFKSKSHEVHQRNLIAYIIARVADDSEKTVVPPVAFQEPSRHMRTSFSD